MTIVNEKATLRYSIKRSDKIDDAQKQAIINEIGRWNLGLWEEALVNQLFPINVKTAAELPAYKNTVDIIRGHNPKYTPIDRDEAANTEFNAELLKNPDWQKRVMRSVYRAFNTGELGGLQMLRKKIEDYTDGNLDFGKLNDPITADFYLRVYIIICFGFFEVLHMYLREYVMRTDLLLMAILMGFDLKEIIKKYMSTLVSIYERKDQCFEFASYLMISSAIIGQDAEGKLLSFKDWLDEFRQYSKNKMSQRVLFEFLNQPRIDDRLDDMEKNVLQVLLDLYMSLVDYSLLIPEGDIDVLVAQIASGKLKTKWTRDMNGNLSNSSQPTIQAVAQSVKEQAQTIVKPLVPDWGSVLFFGIGKRAEQIDAWLKSQNDAAEAKQDILLILDSLSWKTEPCFSNLLAVSALFEQRFGEQNGALLYFDDTTQDFVINRTELVAKTAPAQPTAKAEPIDEQQAEELLASGDVVELLLSGHAPNFFKPTSDK